MGRYNIDEVEMVEDDQSFDGGNRQGDFKADGHVECKPEGTSNYGQI